MRKFGQAGWAAAIGFWACAWAAFGGDASSPSEDAHIEQVREAMDKASAVPPLAGGVVRARIGNLSSANALRITLMSLLAKTERKRQAYGRGIVEMNGLILRALDASGVLRLRKEARIAPSNTGRCKPPSSDWRAPA